jgi:hypothetical protein
MPRILCDRWLPSRGAALGQRRTPAMSLSLPRSVSVPPNTAMRWLHLRHENTISGRRPVLHISDALQRTHHLLSVILPTRTRWREARLFSCSLCRRLALVLNPHTPQNSRFFITPGIRDALIRPSFFVKITRAPECLHIISCTPTRRHSVTCVRVYKLATGGLPAGNNN